MKLLPWMILILSLKRLDAWLDRVPSGLGSCEINPCIHGLCFERSGIISTNKTDKFFDKNDPKYYRCFCPNGYTGYNCQINHDECLSGPCQNDAQCVDGVASFTCICPPGFSGVLCEQNLNECMSGPCLNNGTCKDGVDTYHCICKPGYAGENCEVDISACNLTTYLENGGVVKTCMNGAECLDGPGLSYLCLCAPGYNGANCEKEINECESTPCYNGGVCMDLVNNFQCICPSGWTGKMCNKKMILCNETNICKNGGICLTTKDMSLIDNNEVKTPYLIENHQILSLIDANYDYNSNSSYICYCVPDYYGSYCQYKYDDCLPSPKCGIGEICIDGVNSYCCQNSENSNEGNCTSWTMPSTTVNATSLMKSTPYEIPNSATNLVSSLESIQSISNDYSIISSTFLTSMNEVLTPSLYNYSTEDVFTKFSESSIDEELSVTPTLQLSSVTDIQMSSLPINESIQSISNSYSIISSTFSTSMNEELTPSLYINSTEDVFTKFSESSIDEELFVTPTLQLSSVTDIQMSSLPINESSFSSQIRNSEIFYSAAIPSSEVMSSFPPEMSSVIDGTMSYSTVESYHVFESTLELVPNSTLDSFAKEASRTIFTHIPSINDTLESVISTPEIYLSENISEIMSTKASYLQTYFESTTMIESSIDEEIGAQSSVLGSLSDQFFITSSVQEFTSNASSEITNIPSTNVSTESISSKPHATSPLDISLISPTPPLEQNCSINCQNGGKCIFKNKKTQICQCTLLHSGPECEEEQTLKVPFFMGMSVIKNELKHKFDGKAIKITLEFNSKSNNGLILLLEFGYEHNSENGLLALYLDNGHVTLYFSCGQDSVTLGESDKIKLNYTTYVTLSLKKFKNYKDEICKGELLVNEQKDYPISGTLKSMKNDFKFKSLLFGFLEVENYQNLSLDTSLVNRLNTGWIGCIFNFKINGLEHKLISNESFGTNIFECGEIYCNSKPCKNNGTCIKDGISWYCDCPDGYEGVICERKSCHENLCVNGGTCIPLYFGIGFHCMCPYSYEGLTCELESIINIPYFIGDLYGHSSYMAYARPRNVEKYLEVKISLKTKDKIQNSLIFSIGSLDPKSVNEDFFAVGIHNGRFAFRYNLGSGSVTIISSHEIGKNSTVTAIVGRYLRTGWIYIQGGPNNTGTSPGGKKMLNVLSDIYVGGYSNDLFLTPLQSLFSQGFTGCILETSVRVSPMEDFKMLRYIQHGRNIMECRNNGFSGNLTKYNGSGMGNYSCAKKCLNKGYCSNTINATGDLVPTCDCKFGFSGEFCEKIEPIHTPSFNGRNSYLELKSARYLLHYLYLEMTINPSNRSGLIFYVVKSLNDVHSDFLSISLIDGRVELRYNLGTMKSTTTILSSKQDIVVGEWTKIAVIRKGTEGKLYINGKLNSQGKAPREMISLNVKQKVFVGGVPNLAKVNKWAVSKAPKSFSGCISSLQINGMRYNFHKGHVEGRNIMNCEKYQCAENSTSKCNCHQNWNNEDCQMTTLCKEHKCQNEGSCIPISRSKRNNGTTGPYRCDCKIGFTGKFCEKEMNLSSSSLNFNRNSYLMVTTDNIVNKEILRVEFQTIKDDGMIAWSGNKKHNYDFFGIGLRSGYLSMVVNIGGKSRNDIETDDKYNDGLWHNINVKIKGRILLITVDNIDYSLNLPGKFVTLNTDGIFYFGGFGRGKKTEIRTNGYFDENFSGCFANITVNQDVKVYNDFSNITGSNIEECVESV